MGRHWMLLGSADEQKTPAPDTVEAVRQTRRLYNQAKRAFAPVLFTRVLYARDGSDGGIFLQKVPVLRRMVEGEPLAAFAKELQPGADDVVVTKNYASAFFGTSLASTVTGSVPPPGKRTCLTGTAISTT